VVTSGRRRIALMAVSTVAGLVLLFSYRTSLGGSVPGTAQAAAEPGIVPAPGTTTGPSAAAVDPGAGDLTVNGSVASTRWGPVQVQVKISDRKLVDVRVLRRPDGNRRDDEINSYALPRLRQEVLSAQSARIDAVSGATVTSDGYIESLQAALDTAHFG
jgi:uncharacterized protein with FMN-binding domain